jgi:hypothetical protein
MFFGASIVTHGTTDDRQLLSPSFWPSTYFDLNVGTGNPLLAGDDIQVSAVIENQMGIAANITFIIQMVNSEDVAVSIQEFRAFMSPSDETLSLVNSWKTEKPGFLRVEAFLLADERLPGNKQISFPISPKWAAATLIRPASLDSLHDLRVEIQIDNPQNVTAGSLKGSIELVNYGNASEIVKIEPESTFEFWLVGIPRPTAELTPNDCNFWQGFELNDVAAYELPAQGRIKLNSGNEISIPYSLDHAGFYELSWNAKLRLQEPDGVQCVFVPSNKVRFNVTAPTYEGISLVLSADKQSYSRNETVRFEAQIENASDAPLETKANEIMIHIQDQNGKNILWSSFGISDISPYVIPNHSNYTLDHLTYPPSAWSWEWDQNNYTSEGVPFVVEPGRYLIYATFSSPPMKSQTIEITIE